MTGDKRSKPGASVIMTQEGDECPAAEDGIQYFSCPSPDETGLFHCIDDHSLCDQVPHCPNEEDEDKTVCMFHQMVRCDVVELYTEG